MKFSTTSGGRLEILVRDLTKRKGVTLREIQTRGGKNLAAGSKVMLEGYSRYVTVWTETCAHCGVKFSVRLDAREATSYVTIVDDEEPS